MFFFLLGVLIALFGVFAIYAVFTIVWMILGGIVNIIFGLFFDN